MLINRIGRLFTFPGFTSKPEKLCGIIATVDRSLVAETTVIDRRLSASKSTVDRSLMAAKATISECR